MLGHWSVPSSLRSSCRTGRRRLAPYCESSGCDWPCGSSQLFPHPTPCTGKSGAGCRYATLVPFCHGTKYHTKSRGYLGLGSEVAPRSLTCSWGGMAYSLFNSSWPDQNSCLLSAVGPLPWQAFKWTIISDITPKNVVQRGHFNILLHPRTFLLLLCWSKLTLSLMSKLTRSFFNEDTALSI